MAFDPSTQNRKDVFINARMADIYGMHKEELLSRLAGHDLPLPLPDMDFVRVFLYLILRGIAVPGLPRVKYLRMLSGPRERGQCVLVCWCSLSIVGPDDRVTEVLLRVSHPSESDGHTDSDRLRSMAHSNLKHGPL